MSRVFREHFIKELKRCKKLGDFQVTEELSRLRKKVDPSLFRTLMESLAKVSPKLFEKMRTKGQSHFRDLLWNSPFSPMTLAREIQFANDWLCELAPVLNNFRSFSLSIDKLILDGRQTEALEKVVSFRKTHGHSMWSVELEYSLASISMTPTESRKYISDLSKNSSKRIASLLDLVLRDRNYLDMKIAKFVTKCQNSFPEMGFPPHLVKYLYYRAFSNIGDVTDTGADLLAVDFATSPFDYYETLIDVCTEITTNSACNNHRKLAETTARNLINYGYEDSRLHRIICICSDFTTELLNHPPISNGTEQLVKTILGETVSNPINFEFIKKIKSHIKIIKYHGSTKEIEFEWLFKIALNFKGLPFGAAIISFMNTATGLNIDGGLSPWLQFYSAQRRIEDLLAINPVNIVQILSDNKTTLEKNAFTTDCLDVADLFEEIIWEDISEKNKNLILWHAYKAVRSGKLYFADKLCEKLIEQDKSRSREYRKVQLLIALKEQDIERSISIAADFIIDDHRNGFELPLIEIFKNRKWRDFKNMDPIRVGIVANIAKNINSDSNIKYICGMACREYNLSKDKFPIISFHSGKTEVIRPTIEFLKSVWMEDNLTLSGFLTTQEIQKNRLDTLNILVQIDLDENSNPRIEYTDEIKELIFKDILYEGLKQIEGSRIFVNEGPIARWAEGELQYEYAKWKALVISQGDSILSLDDILRSYFIKDISQKDLAIEYAPATEADFVLISIVNRIFNRFLLDQSDGLNSYLSSRIRHGTLKGTLLGPLEEAGLLGMSDDEIASDWRVTIGNINKIDIQNVKFLINKFNISIEAVCVTLINDIIQVRSRDNPRGAIFPITTADMHVNTFSALAQNSDFSSFVTQCFNIFWTALGHSLNILSSYFKKEVKNEIQLLFDSLIQDLRLLGGSTTPLITSLRTVSTATQSQCDLVSSWFTYDQSLATKVFPIESAVKIATATTRNVYRLFPPESVFKYTLQKNVTFTSLGLLAITDCLYIMLENCFKHSGLKEKIPLISITTSLESNEVLVISVSHPVSEDRLRSLKNGGLDEIIDKYLVSYSPDRAVIEGGSGFAKLLRITRTIDPKKYLEPIKVHFDADDTLHVTVCIPIYLRGDAFDAYFG